MPRFFINTLLADGFLAGGSRQEKASVRLPCSGKKLDANVESANMNLTTKNTK